MKKIIFSLLMMALCISTHVAWAAMLKSNTVRNDTDAPITIILNRNIDCFDDREPASVFSRLEPGQTGLAFLETMPEQAQSEKEPSCTSNVTKLMAMQGFLQAVIENPKGITRQDYKVSLKTTPVPGQSLPDEKLVIEPDLNNIDKSKYYITAESITFTNNTEAPLKFYMKRRIQCPEEPVQISNIIIPFKAGQKGLVFIKGGALMTCKQDVVKIIVVGSGSKAVIEDPNGITPKDYTISLKTIPGKAGKRIVIE